MKVTQFGLVESTAATANATTNVTSGVYTPTLTNVTNIASSTTRQATYIRVGNSVTVAGQVDVDSTTSAGTSSELGISLPVASGFTTAFQCGGTAVSKIAASTFVVSQTGGIQADATNDRASLQYP